MCFTHSHALLGLGCCILVGVASPCRELGILSLSAGNGFSLDRALCDGQRVLHATIEMGVVRTAAQVPR